LRRKQQTPSIGDFTGTFWRRDRRIKDKQETTLRELPGILLMEANGLLEANGLAMLLRCTILGCRSQRGATAYNRMDNGQ
jgi:hypothetical protein